MKRNKKSSDNNYNLQAFSYTIEYTGGSSILDKDKKYDDVEHFDHGSGSWIDSGIASADFTKEDK